MFLKNKIWKSDFRSQTWIYIFALDDIGCTANPES